MCLESHAVTEKADLEKLQRIYKMQKFHSALLVLPTVNNQSVDVNFWSGYHAWIHCSGLGPSVVSITKILGLCRNFLKVQTSTLMWVLVS